DSFVSASADNLALHSFPTRRSSDLGLHCRRISRLPIATRTALRACCTSACATQAHRFGCAQTTSGGCPGRLRWRHRSHHGRNLRSEEHTSELQSRRDLVCRLLLEKK